MTTQKEMALDGIIKTGKVNIDFIIAALEYYRNNERLLGEKAPTTDDMLRLQGGTQVLSKIIADIASYVDQLGRNREERENDNRHR